MKKFYQRIGIGVLIALIGFSVIGCVSTTPIMYVTHSNATADFIILGEVTHQARQGRRQGLIDFLDVARREFPEADWVINIMVDQRETLFFSLPIATMNVFRGTAVKFINP